MSLLRFSKWYAILNDTCVAGAIATVISPVKKMSVSF